MHADGSARTVDCIDGLVVVDLQPADAGGEMQALDANGRPVMTSRTLVPSPVEERPRAAGAPSITTVVLLENGVMTGRARVSGERPYADFTRRTRIDEIGTSMGTATLWTAPTKTGGRCTWVQLRGLEIPVVPCTPKGRPLATRLALAVFSVDGRRVVAGVCGYREVQLVSVRGRGRTVGCGNGLLFTTLQPSEVPGELRPIGRNGKALGISAPLLK